MFIYKMKQWLWENNLSMIFHKQRDISHIMRDRSYRICGDFNILCKISSYAYSSHSRKKESLSGWKSSQMSYSYMPHSISSL